MLSSAQVIEKLDEAIKELTDAKASVQALDTYEFDLSSALAELDDKVTEVCDVIDDLE